MVMRSLQDWPRRRLPRAERLCSSTSFGSASQDRLHGGDDVLDGEAEMLEQHACRRRFAETVDADDGAARIVDRADILAPEIGHSGLDGDARYTARKHRRLPRRVLAV